MRGKKSLIFVTFFALFVSIARVYASAYPCSSVSNFVSLAVDVPPTVYALMVLTVFMIVVVIAEGIYVIITHNRLSRMVGLQKQLKQLENKMTSASIGLGIGGILIAGFYVVERTPYYFWANSLPDPFLHIFNFVFNSTTLGLMILLGLGLLISMLIPLAYYSQKLQKLKKLTSRPIQ